MNINHIMFYTTHHSTCVEKGVQLNIMTHSYSYARLIYRSLCSSASNDTQNKKRRAHRNRKQSSRAVNTPERSPLHSDSDAKPKKATRLGRGPVTQTATPFFNKSKKGALHPGGFPDQKQKKQNPVKDGREGDCKDGSKRPEALKRNESLRRNESSRPWGQRAPKPKPVPKKSTESKPCVAEVYGQKSIEAHKPRRRKHIQKPSDDATAPGSASNRNDAHSPVLPSSQPPGESEAGSCVNTPNQPDDVCNLPDVQPDGQPGKQKLKGKWFLNHLRFKLLFTNYKYKRPSQPRQYRNISGASRVVCFKKVLYNQVMARGPMLYPAFNRRKQKHSYSMVVNNHRVRLGKMFSYMSKGLITFYTGVALKAAQRPLIVGPHKVTLKRRASPYLVSHVESDTSLLLTRCQLRFSLRRSRQLMNHRKSIKALGLFLFGDTNYRYHKNVGSINPSTQGRNTHGSVLRT